MPKRVLAGGKEVRTWWRSRVAAYGSHFFASAVTDLDPRAVDSVVSPNGRQFSAVFDRGTRHYCFELQADRDRFVRKYGKAFNARPVGKDPYP